MAKWQDEYSHERAWKATDPTRVATPQPALVPELGQAFREYLSSRGLEPDVASRLGGWYPAYHRGPRIIIPCIRTDGGQWWQARLMDTLRLTREIIQIQPLKRWEGASGYKHDAVSYIPAEYERPTIIVEGPMDALAAAGCGFPAIAILGATPPQLVYEHTAKLVDKSYRKGTAIIIPDTDRLGAWVDTQAALGALGVYARIQQLPGAYKDLAEMPADEREEFLNGAAN